jgi:single-stranded DNA-specific DHH superfamily exonuclease
MSVDFLAEIKEIKEERKKIVSSIFQSAIRSTSL